MTDQTNYMPFYYVNHHDPQSLERSAPALSGAPGERRPPRSWLFRETSLGLQSAAA